MFYKPINSIVLKNRQTHPNKPRNRYIVCEELINALKRNLKNQAVSFLRPNMWMANKHMKRWSISLVIRQMQIKPQWGTNSIHPRVSGAVCEEPRIRDEDQDQICVQQGSLEKTMLGKMEDRKKRERWKMRWFNAIKKNHQPESTEAEQGWWGQDTGHHLFIGSAGVRADSAAPSVALFVKEAGRLDDPWSSLCLQGL